MSVRITPIIPSVKQAFQKVRATKLAAGLTIGITLGGIAGVTATQSIAVGQINERTTAVKNMIHKLNLTDSFLQRIENVVKENSDKSIKWYDLPATRAMKISQEWHGNLIYLLSMIQNTPSEDIAPIFKGGITPTLKLENNQEI